MENNMKQFNLQEYLKNPERKVITRDGRKVRIICTDFDNPDFPVVGEIQGNKWPLSFATNGEAIKGRPLACDLFFAPTIVKRWGIVYRKSERLFDTREEAEKWMEEADDGEKKFCSVCKVEWEEE